MPIINREKRARKEGKGAKKDGHKKGKGKGDEPKRSKKAIRRAEKKAIKKAKAEAKQEHLQYQGNKAWRRSASAAAPPPSPPEIFGGKKKDFEAWRHNMERKFKSRGMWEVVEPGYVEPKQKEFDKLPQYESERLMSLNSAAIFLIKFSVEEPLRDRYLQSSSAKKVWQKLIDRYQT